MRKWKAITQHSLLFLSHYLPINAICSSSDRMSNFCFFPYHDHRQENLNAFSINSESPFLFHQFRGVDVKFYEGASPQPMRIVHTNTCGKALLIGRPHGHTGGHVTRESRDLVSGVLI